MARHCPLLPRLAAIGLIIAAAAASAPPSAADWLVLEDGSRLETGGPWEIRGTMLVFKLPNGTLSSLRASDVDLEASAAATAKVAADAARAREPKATPPPEPRAPLIVITDADIPPAPEGITVDVAEAEPAGPTEGTEREGGTSRGTAAADGSATGEEGTVDVERLQIVSHSRDMGADAVTVIGELLNQSQDMLGRVAVTALLYDEEGKLLASADALMGANVLQPGQHTTFRAIFPGVSDYSQVRFETSHIALRTAPATQPSQQ